MDNVPDTSGSREPFKFRGTYGHDNAHDAAKYWQTTGYAHPAHRDSYQHAVWGLPKDGEKFPSPDSRRVFDSVQPGTDKEGRKGIFAKAGAMSSFIPNETIGAMESFERKDVPDFSTRAENYNKRLPHTATQADAAPGSQAALTFK